LNARFCCHFDGQRDGDWWLGKTSVGGVLHAHILLKELVIRKWVGYCSPAHDHLLSERELLPRFPKYSGIYCSPESCL
jgi:hypothetical protein